MSGNFKDNEIKICMHKNPAINRHLSIISIILSAVVFLIIVPLGIWGCKSAGQDSSREISGDLEEGYMAEEDNPGASAAVEEDQLPEIRDISTKRVLEIINNDEDYIILDVRTSEEYKTGHLKGALLIPVQELEARLDELEADKPIIVYCKSGQRSRKAAEILAANGFTDIYDMGGILDWSDKGYPVEIDVEDNVEIDVEDNNEEEVKSLDYKMISVEESFEFYGNENYIFLDVRSLEEYEQGHIRGAMHISTEELLERLADIPREKGIITYCNGAGCDRSGWAAVMLLRNDFEEVYDMGGGGIYEWMDKGYPIESLQ